MGEGQVNHLAEYIDHYQLEALSGGDRAFESELLKLYLQDSLEQLQKLEAAASSQDLPQAREFAHHIKGASANVGAASIAQLAARIEGAAKAGDAAEIAVPLSLLRRNLEGFRAAFKP